MAIEAARRHNKLPIDVLIVDLEAQYNLTVEYINRTVARDEVNAYWDGFHRTAVCKEVKEIKEDLKGFLPVTRLDKTLANRVASTVRHNMARGTHQVELSAKLVAFLKRNDWTNKRIGEELGMDPDEVLRLKQITGLAEAFQDKEFSKSWGV